jgi:hypothetical protein
VYEANPLEIYEAAGESRGHRGLVEAPAKTPVAGRPRGLVEAPWRSPVVMELE